LKENLETLIAAIGCMPILAAALFVAGAITGEMVTINAPPPPQWLLPVAVLLPLFVPLYLRAYRQQAKQGHWLDDWRQVKRRRPVGQRASKTVEEAWLEAEIRQPAKNPARRLLDNTPIWGWAALISFLALAYIFIWLGLMAAR
jgi:hypothetical protein